MTIAPIHPDPRIVATFAPLLIAAAALAIGLALRKIVNRFLDGDDPRRQLIA